VVAIVKGAGWLSKFQDALPPATVAEMLGSAFLDVKGARQVLGTR